MIRDEAGVGMQSMANAQADFVLNRALDTDRLAQIFRAHGRIRIVDFLENPEILADHLAGRDDWLQVLNAKDRIFELSRETRKGFSHEKRTALNAAVYEDAKHGFQFRFESLRVSDDCDVRAQVDDPLNRFAQWMGSAPVLEFLGRVTDMADLNFADAQATRFDAGDFLTGHDDKVEGKYRRAAYVLGLTPQWRPEWGGLLMYHGPEGGEAVALPPAYNTLDIFAIPVPHSVSFVTPFAGASRISVTGWLRALP
ncbi:MAG TPA: 2OG-Fe(II) oxygenase family protein [Sphingomonas sanguinis]|uniref:2OG-Fe(II) oxygenase n=1 Tax=Sphingomonas sanguinis TaxID=33051 RepID=UPI002ABF8864|nr:2OG-Fe(II) oxygenase family protein [Sphingomonas sanguinis]